jgi:smad nuclear-interacting protein 1
MRYVYSYAHFAYDLRRWLFLKVIQYRAISQEVDGRIVRVSKPYIMDLASTNKTYLNNVAIEDSRYYELKAKDVIKFGYSSREYVLLNEDLVSSK